MSVHHVCADAQRGQKKALDPLKLELQADEPLCLRGRREERESIYRLYHQASDLAFYPGAESMPPSLVSGI